MGDVRISKFVEDYIPHQTKYKEFAEVICSILEKLLRKNGFRYQAIIPREKDPDSLKRKITSNKDLLELTNVFELNDLAGCRIIFYLDSDARNFERIIRPEFEVLDRILKYSKNDYNGIHLIVQLNSDRTKLNEYSEYVGMKCEIQLTTVLFHAWAELAHDTIYKPPEGLSEFDNKAYQSIKDKYARIMEDHIKEASYSFEFLHSEFQKLIEGKAIFDIAFFNQILHSTDNNQLYEQLDILYQYIKDFGDKSPKEIQLIAFLKQVLSLSNRLSSTEIQTIIGAVSGFKFTSIAHVVINIIDVVKYIHPRESIDLLFELSINDNQLIKEDSIKMIAKFTSYDFVVLKRIGFSPQFTLLSRIDEFKDEDLIRFFDAINSICQNLLDPTFESTYMQDYNQFTWQTGPLPVNDTVRTIRIRALEILMKLYQISSDISHQRKIMSSFQVAMRYPRIEGYGDEMKEMIQDNINIILDFYISVQPAMENELISNLEEQLFLLIRTKNQFNDGKLNRLRELIIDNKNYSIFKNFYGYMSHTLETPDLDQARLSKERNIEKFIDDLSNTTIQYWIDIIHMILKNYQASEPGCFHHLRGYFINIGTLKPLLAYEFITRGNNSITPFYSPILIGIWDSKSRKLAKQTMNKWIDEDENIVICSEILSTVSDIDKDITVKLLQKAIKKEDINVLLNLSVATFKNIRKYRYAKELFLKIIRVFSTNQTWRWINNVWFFADDKINIFQQDEFKILLDNLYNAPNIDYHIEVLLKPISQQYPSQIIDFLKSRLKHQQEIGSIQEYQGIPFEFQIIHIELKKHSEIIIPEIFNWFEDEDQFISYHASELIHMIFPSFNFMLTQEILGLIKSENPRNAEIVLDLLRPYSGDKSVHILYQELIITYPDSTQLHNRIIIDMSQMGVVVGEYGFVEGYKEKRKSIRGWKKNKNKAIKEFVNSYEKYLDRRIIEETQRADDRIEMQKLTFR